MLPGLPWWVGPGDEVTLVLECNQTLPQGARLRFAHVRTCYLGNETRLAFKSSFAPQVASQTVSTKQVMGVHICTLCGYWPMADCYYIISSKYDMHKEYVVDAVYMYLSLSTSWGLCCFVIIMVVYWEIHELTLENRRIICTYRTQNMIHCCTSNKKIS